MLSLIYLLQEYKKRVYLTLRQFSLLTLVVTAIFFFAALWPATNFHYTATFQHGLFDLHINGPLKISDIKRIASIFNLKKKDCIVLSQGGGEVIVNDKIYKNPTLIAWGYPPKDFKNIKLTYFSPGLKLIGSMDTTNSWAIDYMTAKLLGVGLGSRVGILVNLGQNTEEKMVKKVFWGNINAVYASTKEVFGLLIPYYKEISENIQKNYNEFATDMFIKLPKKYPRAVIEQKLLPLEKDLQPNIEIRPEAYKSGKAWVEQMLNRNIRLGTVWLALLVYFVYILREQFLRFERRKKNLAVLFSLGLSKKNFYRLFLLEQLFLNAPPVILGFYFGKYMLENFGMYVPNETVYFLAAFLVIINLLVLLATFGQLINRFSRLDVAKLLTSD